MENNLIAFAKAIKDNKECKFISDNAKTFTTKEIVDIIYYLMDTIEYGESLDDMAKTILWENEEDDDTYEIMRG